MIRYISILIISLIVASCNKYILSTEDLKTQFNDSLNFNRVSCKNDKGDKIWLYTKSAKIKILKKNEKEPYTLLIGSVRYKNDTIFGESDVPDKKRIKLSVNDVTSIWIDDKFSNEVKYFNPDSIVKIVNEKNDSLNRFCNTDTRYSIYLRPIIDNVPLKDSTVLYENACYSLVFTDNVTIHHGVIKKITPDSIIITNSFNSNIAKAEKMDYKVLNYPLKAIKELKLMKNNGSTFITLTNQQYKFEIIPFNLKRSGCPAKYTWDKYYGKIYFYDMWLVERGYIPIKELDGHIYW